MSPVKSSKITIVLISLVFLQLIGAIYTISYAITKGYLSAPFIYNKFDTFMDFFNVMFWGDNSGRYTIWGSVYPPLNFLFMDALQPLFFGNTSFFNAFQLRENAPILWILIPAFYLTVLAGITSSKLLDSFNSRQKTLFFVFVALSAPFLFGMERGNTVILCMPFLAMAMAKSNRWRWFAVAVLLNIKPYFLLFLIAPILAKAWQALLFSVAVASIIFITTGLLVDQNFFYFLPNILSFGQSEFIFSGREVLALPNSIMAFGYALASMIRNGAQIGGHIIDIQMVIEAISLVNTSISLLGFAALVVARNRLSQEQMFAVLTIIICNLGVWIGGYSLMFYAILIPAFLSMRLRWVYISIVVLIFSPLDMLVLMKEALPEQILFFTGEQSAVEYQLGLGTILRPILNSSLLILLSFEIIIGRSLSASSHTIKMAGSNMSEMTSKNQRSPHYLTWAILAVFTVLGAFAGYAGFSVLWGKKQVMAIVSIAVFRGYPVEEPSTIMTRIIAPEFAMKVANSINDSAAATQLLVPMYGGGGYLRVQQSATSNLEITVTAPTEERATKLLSGVINEFMSIQKSKYDLMLDSIQARKARLQKKFNEAQVLNNEYLSRKEGVSLADTKITVMSQLGELSGSFDCTERAMAEPIYRSAEVLVPPTLLRPMLRSPIQGAGLGMLVGFALGFVFIQVRKALV